MKIKLTLLGALLMTSPLLAAADDYDQIEFEEKNTGLHVIKENNPLAMVNGVINERCPAGAREALTLLVNLGISQVPGGKILRFYAATEKDLKNGEGSIARLFGEGVKGLVKKTPGGGYIIELANDIKPNGYESLTEAVIANFVPGGKVKIDQGFNECVKTAIASIPGIGGPIRMAYKFLANYSYEKHGEYKDAALNLFEIYEELYAELVTEKEKADAAIYIDEQYREDTSTLIKEGMNDFVRELLKTHGEAELLEIAKELAILRKNEILGHSYTKGWLSMGLLNAIYSSKYDLLLDSLKPLFPNETID